MDKWCMKAARSPCGGCARLPILRVREGRGIPGVVVKCVEIRRNTRGEGGVLAHN